VLVGLLVAAATSVGHEDFLANPADVAGAAAAMEAGAVHAYAPEPTGS
jgi:hypothetical protein